MLSQSIRATSGEMTFTMIVGQLFLLTTLWTYGAAQVCIVGAGIGGTATAAFLRELDPSTSIVLVERRGDVGGRVKTITIEGVDRLVDAGASIIHKDNKYIVQFAEKLGLEIQASSDASWGVYDGYKFVFESTGSSALDTGTLFLRYGPSLSKMEDLTKKMLEKFVKIYDLQSEGMAFDTPEALLQKLEVSLADMMVTRKIKRGLINEIMAAITRVNYGQNTTLTALAGMISLAGAGSDTRVIKDGFQQIPKGLIRLAKAEAKLNTTVDEIQKIDNGYRIKGTPNFEMTCSDVVVAAPLEQSSMTLPPDVVVPHPRPYQLTQTTFVRGKVKPSYFGKKKKKASLPCAIYTTEHYNNKINSIGCFNHNEANGVFKVFSREALTEEILDEMFEDAEVILSIPWKAYPHYSPPEKFAPFVMAPGLIYINTIESGASAMEVSAIGAKNAALLVNSWLKDRKEEEKGAEKTEL